MKEVEECSTTSFSPGDFVKVQVVQEKVEVSAKDVNDDEEISEQELESCSELFSCPKQGCTLSFKRHSNLETHIMFGKCRLRKEMLTVLDKAKVLYAQKLSEGAAEQLSMKSVPTEKQSEIVLDQGWAIRQTKKTTRFNENQKSYLDDKFLIGQSTGIKADPQQVARDMRNARTENGRRRFIIAEFLTPQQIKSYFSRKASKTKNAPAVEAAEIAQKDHTTYLSTRQAIIQECHIEHPIICDTYNVCKLYSDGKLAKLNVALLRHFCLFFSIDIDGISQHRKAPYISLLKELVLSCSCFKT